NLLQRMSGIATVTQKAIKILDNPSINICDTRKTTPGFRLFEKHAINWGGRINHRHVLYDGVMIKDNHIAAAGSITQAVEKVKNTLGHMVMIEVETESEVQVQEAIHAGANIIMFDNQSPQSIHKLSKLLPPYITTEASGGLTFDNLKNYNTCVTGYLSFRYLNHTDHPLDVSLIIWYVHIMVNILDLLKKDNNATIPEHYKNLTEAEMKERVIKIKKELGSKLFIPAHHYQRNEVVEFADTTGDSLQ